MNKVKIFNIGVDRMSENPQLIGTQAAAVSDDMSYFAITGQNAIIQLWSAHTCRLEGVAKAHKPVLDLKL